MSYTLFSSKIDSEKFGDIVLSVNSDGSLSVISIDRLHSASFLVPPSKDGLKEVEDMIIAFQEWIHYVKQLSTDI